MKPTDPAKMIRVRLSLAPGSTCFREILEVTIRWKIRTAFLETLVLGTLTIIAGCKSKEPAEKPGESADKAV
jgi:hypothetical protein